MQILLINDLKTVLKIEIEILEVINMLEVTRVIFMKKSGVYKVLKTNIFSYLETIFESLVHSSVFSICHFRIRF